MADPTGAALERALHHAGAYLEGLATDPVGAATDRATLLERLGAPWAAAGVPAAQVVDDLVAATDGGHLGSAGGRFFAWVIGGSLPSALAADWLTAAWDQNAGIHVCAPAATVAEEVVGRWLTQLFDLPAETSFGLVTGCQVAHVTALAAARQALLARQGWDVAEQGLFGAPPIRVLVNRERHATVDAALNLLGFGRASLRVMELDADGRLSAEALRQALAAGTGPAIVVLQAADLNIGAFDPFPELIPVAHAAGAWVHVDGAFGLWAKASPATRHLVQGMEGADSWATDGHKWLNVPYDSGLVFVRDREAHKRAMTASASYIVGGGEARDPIDWNPEWSRRARGFPIWAALRELGRDGLAELIDRCCAHTRTLAEGIGALPGAERLCDPVLNQALVRFGDDDARTDAIVAAVNASGEAFFSGSTWRGRRVMRISVSNWRTDDHDVRRTIAAVKAALETA